MPNPYRYRSFIQTLARQAGPGNPAYVQLRAAIRLARELSPANPGRDVIQAMLRTVDAYDLARHKLRDLYDGPASPSPGEPAPCFDAGGRADGALGLIAEQETLEEDDDPL